jgi:hypothetical protein
MARDYTDVLFPKPAPASVWRKRLQLDALETAQGLPRGLLTGVLDTESGGRPDAVSEKGAEGLFQFMPPTARAYNLDPYDPPAAARAAARELGSLYRKYQGDLPTTLAAWNWGQGNVDKEGLANAPAETRGFVSAVLPHVQPRRPDVRGRPQGAVTGRGRDFTNELFGGTSAPGTAPAGAPLTAPYQGPTAARTAPPPATVPAAAPVTAPVGDPLAAPYAGPTAPGTAPLAEPRPAPSVVPPGLEDQPYGTVLSRIEPGPPSVPPSRGAPSGEPRILGGTRPMPDLSELETALKRPGEMVPSMATTGIAGYLGGALGAATGPFAPIASPVLAGLASYGAHRLNQIAGLTPGEPEILPRTLEDYLQLGLPMAPLAAPAVKAVGRYAAEPVVRGLQRVIPRARRAVKAAEQQTAQNAEDYLQQYTQEVTRATEQDVQARAGYALDKALYQQKAEGALQAAGEGYLEDVGQGMVRSAQQQAEYLRRQALWDSREAQRRAAYAQRVRQAEEKAASGTAQDVADYQKALADYTTATEQHLAAAQRAQTLPERYRPQMPGQPPAPEAPTPAAATPTAPLRPGARASSAYYQQFEDQAKSLPADLTPARAIAETLQAQMGEQFPSTLPPRMQRVMTDVLNLKTESSVSQVHEFMKSIGRLTRSGDSQTRGAARQLYGALGDSLEQSAPQELQGLLRQAKTTWKQEEGVYELQRKLRMGRQQGLLSRDPQTGNIRLNVGGIVQLMDNEDILQWFTPEVRQQFQADIQRFVGTPALPRQAPTLPPPRVPGEVPPFQPRTPPQGLAQGPPPPYTPPPFEAPAPPALPKRLLQEAPEPYAPPPFEPPAPVEPKLTRRGLRTALTEIGGLAALSHFGGTPGKYLAAAVAAGDVADATLSRILVSPSLRRLLLRSMEPNGTIDPQMYGMLAAVAQELPVGIGNIGEEAARTETTGVGIPYTTERPR